MSEKKTKYHLDNCYIDSPRRFEDFILYQIGRRYCEPGAVIGDHIHGVYYELTIVTGGSGIMMTNGEPCEVKAGDIFLSLPHERHNLLAAEREKFEYDFFSFSTEGEYALDLQSICQARRSPRDRIIHDERISYLVALALSELDSEMPYSNQVLYGMMNQIALYVLRDLSDFGRDTANVSDADIFCRNIMSYIDTHIYSISGLNDVAKSFNYNYCYISDLFKRHTGNTISEYYRNRRLDTAMTLLKEGKKTVREISEILNYSSPFAFSAAFKKRFGSSPRAFKSEGC